MREIKFRGKKINTGKWISGDLSNTSRGVAIIENNGGDSIVVNAETLGQFTGLKDKNGKAIYEGDIVKRFDEIGHIDFRSGKFCAVMTDEDTGYDYCGDIIEDVIENDKNADTIEVIGNIYDNPELLNNNPRTQE